ncbi:MAG: hypothetical protein KC502_15020 [Myxococcales bacterium]|nr:hypothetical protein [Myxococcales bacterium]
MSRRFARLFAATLFGTALFAVVTAHAAAGPRTETKGLITALAGVDTVPPKAVLVRIAPDRTANRLGTIAEDKKVDGWIRVRATSVLPFFGASGVVVLRRLAALDTLETQQRWWAIHGYLRSVQAEKPAQKFAARWLSSRHWKLRDAVVRGLRHRRAPWVKTVLKRQLQSEQHPSVRAAIAHVLKRLPR